MLLCQVRISIGATSIEWGFRANDKGMVVWKEMQEARQIEFPEDFTMIPDAIIYLIRESDNSPVSFLRVRATLWARARRFFFFFLCYIHFF